MDSIAAKLTQPVTDGPFVRVSSARRYCMRVVVGCFPVEMAEEYGILSNKLVKKLLIIVTLTAAAWILIAKIVTGCWTAICG